MISIMERNKSTLCCIVGKRLNVGGGNDPSYRYWVPLVESQIIVKGKFCDTLLPNLEDVCKSAREFNKDIDCDVVLNFLGLDFGCSAERNKGGVPRLKGEYLAKDVNRHLMVFFNLFVLCPKCLKPETYAVTNKKRDSIFYKCKVCGGGARSCDEAMSHKFFSNMLKVAHVKEKVYNEMNESWIEQYGGKGKRKKSKAKKKVKKVISLKNFVSNMGVDCSSEDVMSHLKKMDPENRMKDAINVLNKGCHTPKEIQKAMVRYKKVYSSLIQQNHTDARTLMSFLCFASHTNPSALKDLFGIAYAKDILSLEHIERWYKSPNADSLGFKGMGSGKVSKEQLESCKKAAYEVIKYIRDLEESSSEDEDDTDGVNE